MKFILGIAAGKGGVGKSTLTVNLALCLQKMGKRVGIMDADIYGPSIPKMLPEERPALLKGEKIIPAEKNGIQLLSVAYFLKEKEQAMIARAPIVNGIIKQFFHSVDWGELDCLLIDFPPGTGDIHLTLLQEGCLSGGVVITTPQHVALQDVQKAIALFRHMQVPLFGLVENMSFFCDPSSCKRYYPFGRGGGRLLSQQEGIPFLGEIPIEEEISRCCDAGISLFEVSQQSESAKAYTALAKEIWEQLERGYLKNFKLVSKIYQKDRYQFTIEWADGKISDYRLSQVQRLCNCAKCREASKCVDEDVEARQIISVGRYALRIDFTNGCSKGIYPFSLLYGLEAT